jgi:uncharacterized membrane protein YbhN (UPF0104 family)
MKSTRTGKQRRYARPAIYAVLAALLVWLIVREHGSLGKAVEAARHANGGWLAVGIVGMALSLPATALVYKALSPQPLRFWRTVLVQTAGFCVNKLLPSGTGSAGVSFLYLRANKVKGVPAGSLVVLNNLLGLAGHFMLFWILVALQPSVLNDLQFGGGGGGNTAWRIAAFIALLLVAGAVFMRRRVGKLLRGFVSQLKPLVRSPGRIGLGLLFSMLITLSYTIALYASAHAVGASISLAAAIIALSSSVLATSAIPSPGGIGVAELGAYGGLVAVGVPHNTALAAALLYRVCSFWLPLIVGSLALLVVTHRGYLAKPASK